MNTHRVQGIRAQSVSASFGKGADVVSEIDMHAEPGKITALVGRNGSGKTTLLRCLAGLLPYRGVVSVEAGDLQLLRAEQRAKSIAYVPQRTRLIAPLSVREVVAQARFAHRGAFARPTARDNEAVVDSLHMAGVLHLKGRRFPELSGGEQQRVLIARAMATNAPVLLMDEPTSSQDVRCAVEIHALARRAADFGVAVVMVLHGLDEVRRHADHVVMIDGGRVHASGPPRTVIASGHVGDVFGVDLIEGGGLDFRLADGGHSVGGEVRP